MENILVVFPGALGDFICFLPALENLARDRTVDLLSRSEYADLVPAAVHARSVERYEITRLFVPGSERDERLKRFFASYKSIYSWMGSGQKDFVRNIEHLSRGSVKLFPFRPPDSAVHISDYYLSCVTEKPSGGTFPAVPLRSDVVAWSRRWLSEKGFEDKKILVLAPGSGAKEKNWPGEFFRQVERWWGKEEGGRSLVILGPAEEGWSGDFHDWSGAPVARNLDLAKVAAWLSLCDLYLGNDSGLTHLAAAVGAETVALFGPTDPKQWAPRGKRVTVVSQSVECSPCARWVMKTCPHRKCLTTLKTDAVTSLLHGLLASTETRLLHGRLLDKGVGRH